MTQDPPLVRLLTPAGERLHRDDFDVDITAEDLYELYRDMVMVRRIDAEATALQRQGELGLWAPLHGQEAAQVGSGRALAEDDFVFPTYREHGVAYTRGVPPVQVLGLFRGTTNGGWDPTAHNFGLYTIVIGTQTLHAVGYAMGLQRRSGGGEGRTPAVVAYFGDGASSQGDVNEAFVWAAVMAAPTVFFCQNNQWAISAPSDRQSRIPLYRRAEGFGFPGIRVDGNDVLAVLAVTGRTLEYARAGGGPSLIEAYTYRMGAHTTSDDPTRYRAHGDVASWVEQDPLKRVRLYLTACDLMDPDVERALDDEAEELAARLRADARSLPDPEPGTMFDHVYAEPHPLIDAERAAMAAYWASEV